MAASTLIEPWLSVSGGAKAVEFYKTAFDATEVFHLEDPDGNVVSRLSINGATFWLSDGPANEHKENIPVRMIVTVEDPDTVFAQVKVYSHGSLDSIMICHILTALLQLAIEIAFYFTHLNECGLLR